MIILNTLDLLTCIELDDIYYQRSLKISYRVKVSIFSFFSVDNFDSKTEKAPLPVFFYKPRIEDKNR